ncbi:MULTISPECIES: hypothetical protein [unclassified Lentimonas]|uniref:hypothetical protein n=1 Tax=unclassified Lentimonas TaxID=2630993 RepID=UPI001324443B|nr:MULTISPECIES: hypothetical protein [unclassified Lentimonas]CAA6696872.1 Unannotated [Lentimonas sp. CC10]CAA6696966.1 Unannotated [Lentimonas sp. CC19]CAA7071114.1 Unannotated [Lentimonas sp. CC11]
MIAPVNFDKELTVYLYVSEPFQEQFGLNPENLPEDVELALPADWWSVWRAEQIHFEDDLSWVLFTNAKTLFSFCYRAYRDDYESIIQEFEHGFLSNLKANGVQLPPQVSTRLVPMVGQAEELSNSMNSLAEHYLADIYERDASREDAEIRLWSIPCSDIDYDLPGEAYLRELKVNPPFGVAVVLPDDGDDDPFSEPER